MNKKTKIKNSKDNNAKKDRFEILLEDIQDKMGLVLESYSALDEKFDRKFDEVQEELKLHRAILQEHSRILQEHSRILQEHSRTIVSVQKNIEIMKADIEFIKHSLRKKVDIDEFAVLERRVALLERKMK